MLIKIITVPNTPRAIAINTKAKVKSGFETSMFTKFNPFVKSKDIFKLF